MRSRESPEPEKCLDEVGHGTTNSTVLNLSTGNGGTTQRWSRS